MPKFKLRNILSRVILGKSTQKEKDMDYLCVGFERYHFGESFRFNREEDDDGNSMISISTMETVDDQPETGRFIDTYIFQPMGRRIERLAMRFTIAFLHPARIAQYIEADEIDFPIHFLDWTLNDAIADLCYYRLNGSTVVAGMKGLVKQTQSASALAALVRVSLTYHRNELYDKVSRIEPIFHLETLAASLACSHPDKKWYLFLVKLARETVVAVRSPSSELAFDPVLGKTVYQLWPSPETALNLRQRLIRVLKVYRSSGLDSLEETVGEACAICARAISTSIHYRAQGDAYMHILETVYFTVIFVLRSIHELADYAKNTANTQIYMVLQTLATWIDAIVYRCLHASDFSQRYDIEKLKANILIRSLVYVDGDTTCVLLPQSRLKQYRFRVLDMDTLPRRHQEANVPASDSRIAQGLIEGSKHRTRRLLRSFNELEREVFGIPLETNIPTLQPEIDADPQWIDITDFGHEWWQPWRKALEQAQRVQVPENRMTKEFREAGRIGLEPYLWSWGVDRVVNRNWGYYQVRRGSRHKWGQYLRSNMDWDWDVGACMNRLFKVDKQNRVGPPRAVKISPSTSLDAVPGRTWEIMPGELQGNFPKDVRITYTTETGETQCMTFTPTFPVPARHLTPEITRARTSAEYILDSTVVQQDAEIWRGSSGGEQGNEDLEEGVASSDASQPGACEDTPAEAFNGDCKGKVRAYDFGFDEVWAEGDAISICSLD